jgi:hypothetical protein
MKLRWRADFFEPLLAGRPACFFQTAVIPLFSLGAVAADGVVKTRFRGHGTGIVRCTDMLRISRDVYNTFVCGVFNASVSYLRGLGLILCQEADYYA